MSNQIETKKIEFNTLINLMIEKGTYDELKFLMKIVTEFKDNYLDFCDVLEEHLTNDNDNSKIILFPIIDSIFKSEVGKLYIDKICTQDLINSFEACFNIAAKAEQIMLFKIFYSWKYLIPNKAYEKLRSDLKLDEFKKEVEMDKPGTIAKYKEYRKKFKTEKKKIKAANIEKNDLNNNNNKDKLSVIEPEKDKQKKVLKKKRKLLPKEQENQNIPIKKPVLENQMPNILGNALNAPITNNLPIDPVTLIFNANFSKNEFKLFNFLINNSVTLNKNLPLFSSMAKYYNEALLFTKYPDSLSNFKLINNNETEYQNIRRRMKEKLFQETNKNNCAICGFRTLFYNDLIRHLDIHFNFNYLEMEGKNIYRKNGNNKNNWIYGDGVKNLKKKNSDTVGVEQAKNGTLEILVFYKNMMNNNLVQISNEKKEDNEELMIPISGEGGDKICHYCGDDFKKIFSTKYNSWFYNKVVIVLDEKNKYLAHQACFEELNKKIK